MHRCLTVNDVLGDGLDVIDASRRRVVRGVPRGHLACYERHVGQAADGCVRKAASVRARVVAIGLEHDARRLERVGAHDGCPDHGTEHGVARRTLLAGAGRKARLLHAAAVRVPLRIPAVTVGCPGVQRAKSVSQLARWRIQVEERIPGALLRRKRAGGQHAVLVHVRERSIVARSQLSRNNVRLLHHLAPVGHAGDPPKRVHVLFRVR